MEKTINYLIDLFLNILLFFFSMCIIKINLYVFFNDLFSWVQVASILLTIQVVFLLCSNKVKIKDK